MGCDIVVARGSATIEGTTLFGHNCDRTPGHSQALCRLDGKSFSLGEVVRTQRLEIPQARQTFAVLGCRSAGSWGFDYGVNENQVVVGHVRMRNKVPGPGPCLYGTDLVRLALERGRSARQAVDLLAGLVERHGQCGDAEAAAERQSDNAFAVADGREAFVFEAAGTHWAYQEVQEIRALSDVSTIRQDWDRISPGLADYAIASGWWPGDGSKLDFAAALTIDPMGKASGLRRWGRATLLLEQQNGHIDAAFLRRILSDHYEGMHDEVDPIHPGSGPHPLCQHGQAPLDTATASSLIVELRAEAVTPIFWCALGPPCATAYFPLTLLGDLPESFARHEGTPGTESLWRRIYQEHERARRDPRRWDDLRDRTAKLQVRFDQDAEEFAAEATELSRADRSDDLQPLATSFMQRNLELFDMVWAGRRAPVYAQAARPAAIASSAIDYF